MGHLEQRHNGMCEVTCDKACAAAKRMVQTTSWSSRGGNFFEARTETMWRESKDCKKKSI
jgi:hypothetical protein